MMPGECAAGYPVCCHEEGKGLILSVVAAGYQMDSGCGVTHSCMCTATQLHGQPGMVQTDSAG